MAACEAVGAGFACCGSHISRVCLANEASCVITQNTHAGTQEVLLGVHRHPSHHNTLEKLFAKMRVSNIQMAF